MIKMCNFASHQLEKMWDWFGKCYMNTLLHSQFVICGDVPQTISCSFGGNLNRNDNSLEIPSQSKTWLEFILPHHRGNHLVQRRHMRLRSQIITSGINRLYCVEVSALRKLFYDWCIPTRVASFTLNN